MFGFAVRIEDDTPKVLAAEQKGTFRSLGHWAGSISKDAKSTIEKSKEPSAPGEPPHTRGRGGHNLKTGIRFDVKPTDAVIGPLFSYVGEAGALHEFGESYKGQAFEERPFMGPSLDRSIPRAASYWAHSIG